MSTAVVSFHLISKPLHPFTLPTCRYRQRSRLTSRLKISGENATPHPSGRGTSVQRRLSGIMSPAWSSAEKQPLADELHPTFSPRSGRLAARTSASFSSRTSVLSPPPCFDENGITDWTPSFIESHPAREFCVRYGESDLHFSPDRGPKKHFHFDRCSHRNRAERWCL